MKPISSLRSPRKALLGILVVLAAQACEASFESRPSKEAGSGKITFVAPTPAPIEIFWIDSAGNLGLRGVIAVVPGVPNESGKLPDSCRTSATSNGNGTLTICMEPTVGKALAEKLGFDWTSETSEKR